MHVHRYLLGNLSAKFFVMSVIFVVTVSLLGVLRPLLESKSLQTPHPSARIPSQERKLSGGKYRGKLSRKNQEALQGLDSYFFQNVTSNADLHINPSTYSNGETRGIAGGNKSRFDFDTTTDSVTIVYEDSSQLNESGDFTTISMTTADGMTRIPDFEPYNVGSLKEHEAGSLHKDKVTIFKPKEDAKSELREKAEKTYNDRRMVLRKYCGRRRGWTWLDSMQILAVPERDLAVCTVQKAGSTSWHQLVHDIRYPDQKWNQGERMENWNYSWKLPEQARRRLMHAKTVTRVITVRHPFARLVSAWNNKFLKSFIELNGDKLSESMPGLDKYTGRHPPDSDHVIAFEDLVQYVADVGLENINVHFKSIELLCSPCEFPYDYVIKAETAPEDSWFVTERINMTLSDFTKHAPNLDNPLSSSTDDRNYSDAKSRHTEEKRIISRLFRKVPRETIRVLMALYAADLEAFGYTFNTSTLEIGGYS